MARYRKKPLLIDAVQLTWANWSEICDFAAVGDLEDGKPEGRLNKGRLTLYIPEMDGHKIAKENDWIIREVGKDRLCICKPEMFEAIYEKEGD